MFIGVGTCDWKCCKEAGIPIEICQNSELASTPIKKISNTFLYNRYINNSISKAIVIGGLEPFSCFYQVISFIDYFRGCNCKDDIVIYTGYYPDEIEKSKIESLKKYDNIIIKFGRYKPNSKQKFDSVLGVNLASENQYAIEISKL
jgi:hypothetical protein